MPLVITPMSSQGEIAKSALEAADMTGKIIDQYNSAVHQNHPENMITDGQRGGIIGEAISTVVGKAFLILRLLLYFNRYDRIPY